MATTTVALGKVELAGRKGEQIPDGWAADHEGRVTNTPSDCLNGGGLMPLGGSEHNGGYKENMVISQNKNFQIKFSLL